MSALKFEIMGKFKRARASTMTLKHGDVLTPVFMPVGTKGTIKGLTTDEVSSPQLDCQIILGNTYHLSTHPGAEVVAKFGGLHKFMNWDRNILTDSGGFQMVSLLDLAEINETGVKFRSPIDGTEILLTPEESIRCQNLIGADIIMALDDVVHSLTPSTERFIEATHRTLRWLDRCISAHSRPEDQNLFGICQGGLDYEKDGLREICLKGMLERDEHLPGYAIGGLAGGEDKEKFWRVVEQATRFLPENKPRYLMGVGYPLDIVVCTALGIDMYDCVYPTRTARFGTAFIPSGTLRLKSNDCSNDINPIDINCTCNTCQNYTRGVLHRLCKDEAIGPILITHHNIHYMINLVRTMRQSIIDGKFDTFVQTFMYNYFPDKVYPVWVTDALSAAGIDLL